MRRTLIKNIIEQDTKDTYFLTADVGFGVLESLQKKMGDRLINVGIAETSMISIAAGLALSGKKVYTYTMCSFYLKVLEQVKLDLCAMNLPVTMIGFGKGYEYEQHGISHFALEEVNILKELYNIEVCEVFNKKDLKWILKKETNKPRYIRISRFGEEAKKSRSWVNQNKYPKVGGSNKYLEKKCKHKPMGSSVWYPNC